MDRRLCLAVPFEWRHSFDNTVFLAASEISWAVSAMLAIGAGENATHAAHAAGFSDAAHFSRTMRNMFGVTPRDIMSTVAIEDPIVS